MIIVRPRSRMLWIMDWSTAMAQSSAISSAFMLLQSRWALAEQEGAAQRQHSEREAQHPVHFVVNASQDLRGLRLPGVFLRSGIALPVADRSGALDLDVERRPRHFIQSRLHVLLDADFLEAVA